VRKISSESRVSETEYEDEISVNHGGSKIASEILRYLRQKHVITVLSYPQRPIVRELFHNKVFISNNEVS